MNGRPALTVTTSTLGAYIAQDNVEAADGIARRIFDAKDQLLKLLQATLAGEDVVIAHKGVPVANRTPHAR